MQSSFTTLRITTVRPANQLDDNARDTSNSELFGRPSKVSTNNSTSNIISPLPSSKPLSVYGGLDSKVGFHPAESSVGPALPREAIPTKSGYLPVDHTRKSKLFYVYYEATDSPTPLEDTPWLLWLNGGPGCSSLIGCFYEIGPWWVLEDGSVQPNRGAWNRRYGVLFVDNPVGTGFSVAANDDDVPKDQETVAKHLDHALNYFVQLNPVFRSRPVILAGESYAGKYVPALAYHILYHPSPLRAQLLGIIVGNGLTDPCTQVQAYGDVLYAFGLLDQQQSMYVHETAADIVSLIDREEWVEAHTKRTSLCDWIEHTCGIKTMLDIRRSSRYHHSQDGTEYLAKFLNSPEVKSQLNVDKDALPWLSCRQSIRALMAQDTMKSTKWMVEAVLRKGMPILSYQGMYDVKDGPAGSEAWMRTLTWQHNELFWESERKLWIENGMLAGYIRNMKNLTHVVFVGAGHEVPADQPVNSQILIEKWINSQLEHSHVAKL